MAAAVGRYLEHCLQNHRPRIEIVAARKRGTAYSLDDPAIAERIIAIMLHTLQSGVWQAIEATLTVSFVDRHGRHDD